MNSSVVNQLKLCFNNSCQDVQVTLVYVLSCMCVTALIILTVCGNLLVTVSISHFRQLHTPTNVLLLSLAIADMMVGMTVMPFQFFIQSLCWYMNVLACAFAAFCSSFMNFASVYNVLLIAVDRFYALSNPFQYSKNVTLRTMSVVIGLHWSVSLSYNFFLMYKNRAGNGDMVCIGVCPVVLNPILPVTDLLITFLIPCSLIIILYIKVIAIARRHAKIINMPTTKQHSMPLHNLGEAVPKASETKAAITLGILIVIFVICLCPFCFVTLISPIIPDTIRDQIYPITLTIFSLNSTINPIIYVLLYPKFQRCAKLIVTMKVFHPNSSRINVLLKN